MNFPFNNFFFFGQLIAGKIYGIIKKFSCLIRGFKFEYNFFFIICIIRGIVWVDRCECELLDGSSCIVAHHKHIIIYFGLTINDYKQNKIIFCF